MTRICRSIILVYISLCFIARREFSQDSLLALLIFSLYINVFIGFIFVDGVMLSFVLAELFI